MFLGSFKTYFSGKNRIILPKKFRKELGNDDKFYVLLGDYGEIWGFDQNNWSKQAESVIEIPLSIDEGRVKRLNFFPRADECVLDSQGRFVLPSEFVEKTNFTNEVLIVGAGDHFEIWNPKNWIDQLTKIKL